MYGQEEDKTSKLGQDSPVDFSYWTLLMMRSAPTYRCS